MESEVGNFVCESMKVADLISQISSLKVQQAELILVRPQIGVPSQQRF